MLFFPSYNSPAETNTKELLEMLKSKDVKKIVIVNEKIAEVYLKDKALENEKYKKELKSKGTGLFGEKTPHFQLDIGNYEVFSKRIDEAQKTVSDEEKVYAVNETRRNLLFELFQVIGPIILILVIFLFFMRRMGGGGGGGVGPPWGRR